MLFMLPAKLPYLNIKVLLGSCKMSEKQRSNQESLEVLDFIVMVLKEHEKDLDELVNKIGALSKGFGKKGKLNKKIDNIEERIDKVEKDFGYIANFFSQTYEKPNLTTEIAPIDKRPVYDPQQSSKPTSVTTPIILNCKQWEDFKELAKNSQQLSFMLKEGSFQVHALKDNRIITFSGDFPKLNLLLRTWLSTELISPVDKIFEGILTIG